MLQILKLFSFQDLRKGLLGFAAVAGGIILSALTYLAHSRGDIRLASISAVLSLVFVILILIFVVPPLARNASKEVSQMNLPFELTAGGAIMFGLIFIVGFSAWNSGNNLLFLVLSFMAAAMMVGFIAGSLCIKKLDVKMRFPETIFVGEKAQILVSVNNRKRLLPSFSVVVEVRGSGNDTSSLVEELKNIMPERLANLLGRSPIIKRTLTYFVCIPRNTAIENKSVQIFPKRGKFLIKDFELSTRFPFGFFRHRRKLPARETELFVFPNIAALNDDPLSIQLEAGRVSLSKKGDGLDLLAMRGYQPSDDPRKIDWKATARSRELIVREFAADDDGMVTIWFDKRISRDTVNEMPLRERLSLVKAGESITISPSFEEAVEFLASLTAYFCNRNTDVRLIIGDHESEFGTGSRHLHQCLKLLAVLEPEVQSVNSENGLQGFRPAITADNTNDHNIIISANEVDIDPNDALDLEIIRF